MRDCCYTPDKWDVLIVDNEIDILNVTKFALFNFKYMDKKLNLINASSKAEAMEKLKANPNISVAFIDIIMEENDSGLKLVEYIRKELNNYKIRLVIRTGQPGDYPERKVIEKYEINDYKSKDELTEDELFCTMTTAIRGYCDLIMLEYYKELEHQLIQDSKMSSMGEMIGMIAHQWQQPLNLMSLITGELEMSHSSNNLDVFNFESFINRTYNQIHYMSQTINDFRGFLKPDREKKLFNVKKSLESIFTILDVILKQKNIKYALNSENNYLLNGYETEFKQAVINIITNAKDVLSEKIIEKGFIKINIKLINNEIIISIKDNGGGVDKRLLPNKLFENYITTKGLKGTGMGLYITKHVIENSFNGKILCKNWKRGAEFIIKMPNVKVGIISD